MNLFDGVVLKKLQKFEDNRGWLCEIYREDEIDYKISKTTQSAVGPHIDLVEKESIEFDVYRPVMSYISMTNPGITRGPHEHKYQTDFFVFVGPGEFTIYLWDNRKQSSTYGQYMEITAGEDNPMYIIVPPGIVHGYKCTSETPAWSINLPDKLYKGPGKLEEIDEIRWEQMEDSPYKIN